MEAAQQGRWAAVDWSDRAHTVVILEPDGKEVIRFEVQHTAEGLSELVAKLREAGPISGVAIETTRNLVVVKLLETGFVVYPINPKLSDAWRQGWKVAAPKCDATDTRVLADGLRQHHAHLKPLRPEDPKTRELALLCADECRLIQERTADVTRLQATLKEYFPEILEWFEDWTSPAAWDFVMQFPHPDDLARTSKKKLVGFLKTHSIGLGPIWQERLEKRSSRPAWTRDAAVAQAKSLLAITLAKRLRSLQDSLAVYRKRIKELFDEHPDSGIFSSLPGAGPKLAPRLLSMFGADRERYDSAESVQQMSGTAPVTLQSGKTRKPFVTMRRACRKDYRTTLHLFAKVSVQECEWARKFYDQARAKRQSYACALRNLASKWLKIMFRMWKSRTRYDESLYLESLKRRHSPLAEQLGLLKVGG